MEKQYQSSKKEIKFSGGDELTDFKKIVHEFMMKNELINGYGGYEVKFAGTKNSGLSFGGNQMDMSERAEARKIFVDILKNATDSQGEKIISSLNLPKILGPHNKKILDKNKTPKEVFGENLDRVNAALKSEYGIKSINKSYLENINTDIAHIEKAIDLMANNPAAQAFYSTDFGKAFLFDYHNQYNLSLDGVFMKKYIDGTLNHTPKNIYGTETFITAPTNHYDLTDHINYLHSTKAFAENAKMVDGRLAKSLATLYAYELTPQMLDLFDPHLNAYESNLVFDELGNVTWKNPLDSTLDYYEPLFDAEIPSFDVWANLPSTQAPLLMDTFFVAPTYSLYDFYQESVPFDVYMTPTFDIDYCSIYSPAPSWVVDTYTSPVNIVDNYTNNDFYSYYGNNSGLFWNFSAQPDGLENTLTAKSKPKFLSAILKNGAMPCGAHPIVSEVDDYFEPIRFEELGQPLFKPELYALA